MTRICSDCPLPISRTSKGRCRSCSAKWLCSDPEISARRAAARTEFFARPETKQALRERLARYIANMPDADRQKRSARGRATVTVRLHTPEAKAKALEIRLQPEIQARRVRTMVRTRLPWCPEHLLPLYRDLTRQGLSAAEARAALQDQIPGTPEHTARVLANFTDAQRIRQERERAQAY